ncbi:EF-hand domain-containing protein [Litoreibacter arenae]|uniref:hypothetical protein n=1 Tax=Litoreibacter arenae TaxID=491388 RepID=UPI0014701A3F|nr:hypothetical protein [Litoreibacter arenae]
MSDEDKLNRLLRQGIDRAQETAINHLYSMAPTGELTRDMAETIDQHRKAEFRANILATMLRNDLDGDGVVSRDEIDRLRAVFSGNHRSRLETLILKADADENGELSANEIAVDAERGASELQLQRGRRDLRGTAFMIFDADKNDVVIVDEVLKTINRVARETHATINPARQNRSTKDCDLPKPSSDAVAVYVGGYEGRAISTVAVAGLDRETSFATLEIEDGDDPVYIVLSVFDAMIVRVTGATERVERFVGHNRHGLGVVGLPKEVVDLTSSSNCRLPSAHKIESSDGFKAKALLTAKLGKEIHMIGQYGLGRMALPSGRSRQPERPKSSKGGLIIQNGNRRFQLTPDGVEEIEKGDSLSGAYSLLHRYYPGGVESVMPEDVITNGKAEAYDVLPQQAGLIQLLESGALSLLRDGTYSIDKPIKRFPAGLNGGHSVKFMLRRGVPMPAGSPGHSAVLIEETGKCLGVRC